MITRRRVASYLAEERENSIALVCFLNKRFVTHSVIRDAVPCVMGNVNPGTSKKLPLMAIVSELPLT